MTNWGYLLLALFVALGVSGRATRRSANKYAVVAIVIVFLYVFTEYGAMR